MTKTTYKRKHIIGGLLAVSGGEFMTIMVGVWQQTGGQTGMFLKQYPRVYI